MGASKTEPGPFSLQACCDQKGRYSKAQHWRGGLHTDDLLWKPGFTSWKSVQAVCGVNSLNSTLLRAALPDAEYLPSSDASSGVAEIAEAADASGPTLPKANELQASEGDEPEPAGTRVGT